MNFITVCFYYMIINIHHGHDAFVPSDDAGVALTKKVDSKHDPFQSIALFTKTTIYKL